MQTSTGLAQVIVIVGRLRPQGDGPADVLHGQRMLSALLGNDSQQVQRIGVVRVGLEDAVVDLFRHREPPGLMVGNRDRQGFGEGCHRRRD